MPTRKYQQRIRAVRCEQDGHKFDSKSELVLYNQLVKTFKGCSIIRPCALRLPGKVRPWRCDFGIVANNSLCVEKLTSLKLIMNNNAKEAVDVDYYDSQLTEILYLEYKGETDLTTGLVRIDKNFKERIEWLSRYADHVLDNVVVIGRGTGGILSYCTSTQFRVTPVHSTEFFLSKAKNLWLA